MHYTIIIVPLALIGCTSTYNHRGAKERQGLEAFKANSTIELAESMDRILQASTEKLNELIADKDCQVCLAAAWERVYRALPKEEREPETDRAAPNPFAMSRFLGLIEGRLGVNIPESWEAAFASVNISEQIYVSFPENDTEGADGEGAIQKASVVLEQSKGHLIVKQGAEIWLLPSEDQWVENASVALTDEHAYLAAYSQFPVHYRLYKLDRQTGNILWVARVWADGGLMSYTGMGWHHVDLQVTTGTIVVFGISTVTAYVEAFDKRSGESRCRFGTRYLEFAKE